jgi:serpin B
MSPEPLTITDVLQETYISVDEAGTEAAAATAVVVGATAAPAQPVSLRVDRPFVFWIVDQPTGALLFLGRVTDPTAR